MIAYAELVPEDFLEWGVEEFPHPTRMFGFATRRAGELVAIGVAWIDEDGQWWCGFRGKGGFPHGIHRQALKTFAGLARAGVPEIRAGLDLSVPRSRDWLIRLGFVPEDEKEEVWIRGLSSTSSGLAVLNRRTVDSELGARRGRPWDAGEGGRESCERVGGERSQSPTRRRSRGQTA